MTQFLVALYHICATEKVPKGGIAKIKNFLSYIVCIYNLFSWFAVITEYWKEKVDDAKIDFMDLHEPRKILTGQLLLMMQATIHHLKIIDL